MEDDIKKIKEKDTKDIYAAITETKCENSLKGKMLYLTLLKNEMNSIQDNTVSLESKALRNKYFISYVDLFNKIGDIVKETSDETINQYLTQEDRAKYKIEPDPQGQVEIKPIDNFWLDAFANSGFFIPNKKDKKVLASLYDVKAFTNADCSEFSITFYFKENEYFTNSKLCKKYIIDTKRERVIKSEFDEINWKSENVRPDRKKKVKKGTNKEKLFPDDSFFDMFNSKISTVDLDDSECEFLKETFMPCIMEFVLNFEDDSDNDEGD